jgi:release factor glutamine methyltransferase
LSVTQYEPHIALFTESDPLIFYKRIADLAIKTAQKGTQIWMETHQDYCKQVAELFETVGKTTKIEDLSGNPRFVFCVKH